MTRSKKQSVHAPASGENEPSEASRPRDPQDTAVEHGENLDRGAPTETSSTASGVQRKGVEQEIEPQRTSLGTPADRRSDEPDFSVNGRSDGSDRGAATARETD